MKNKIKEIISTSHQHLIKVRLDSKTFVTLPRLSSLQFWLKRYPDAKVMS